VTINFSRTHFHRVS